MSDSSASKRLAKIRTSVPSADMRYSPASSVSISGIWSAGGGRLDAARIEDVAGQRWQRVDDVDAPGGDDVDVVGDGDEPVDEVENEQQQVGVVGAEQALRGEIERQNGLAMVVDLAGEHQRQILAVGARAHERLRPGWRVEDLHAGEWEGQVDRTLRSAGWPRAASLIGTRASVPRDGNGLRASAGATYRLAACVGIGGATRWKRIRSASCVSSHAAGAIVSSCRPGCGTGDALELGQQRAVVADDQHAHRALRVHVGVREVVDGERVVDVERGAQHAGSGQ